MKTTPRCLLIMLLCWGWCTCDEAPLPRGVLLLLPPGQPNITARPDQTTKAPMTTAGTPTDNAGNNNMIATQSGVYYLYLSDGSLRKVEYNVSTQTPDDQPNTENKTSRGNDGRSIESAPVEGNSWVPLSVITVDQLVRSWHNLDSARQDQEPAKENQDTGASSGPRAGKDLAATLRLSQVKPITGPLYVYSPQSIIRVLRNAREDI